MTVFQSTLNRDGFRTWGRTCSLFSEHLISLPLGSSRFHSYIIYTCTLHNVSVSGLSQGYVSLRAMSVSGLCQSQGYVSLRAISGLCQSQGCVSLRAVSVSGLCQSQGYLRAMSVSGLCQSQGCVSLRAVSVSGLCLRINYPGLFAWINLTTLFRTYFIDILLKI